MAVYMYKLTAPDGHQTLVTFDEGFSLMKQERILGALAKGVHPAHTVEDEGVGLTAFQFDFGPDEGPGI